MPYMNLPGATPYDPLHIRITSPRQALYRTVPYHQQYRRRHRRYRRPSLDQRIPTCRASRPIGAPTRRPADNYDTGGVTAVNNDV